MHADDIFFQTNAPGLEDIRGVAFWTLPVSVQYQADQLMFHIIF